MPCICAGTSPAMSWCTTGQKGGQFLVDLLPPLLRSSISRRRNSSSRRLSSSSRLLSRASASCRGGGGGRLALAGGQAAPRGGLGAGDQAWSAGDPCLRLPDTPLTALLVPFTEDTTAAEGTGPPHAPLLPRSFVVSPNGLAKGLSLLAMAPPGTRRVGERLGGRGLCRGDRGCRACV